MTVVGGFAGVKVSSAKRFQGAVLKYDFNEPSAVVDILYLVVIL